MTDSERDIPQADSIEVDADQTADCAPKPPRWKRVLKWTLVGVGGTLVFLVFAAVMLYNFGGMSGSVYPELGPQYQQLVASGQAPALRKRFVLPIPGCQCHSTDPVLTAQHTSRHMNECGKCHNTSPAHMEPGVL
jgi:hypothetical protein